MYRMIWFTLGLLCLVGTAIAQPLNDIVDRTILEQKPPLDYQPVTERDILWEKRVWRVLDVREKINLPFYHPTENLYDHLKSAGLQNELTLYSPEDDQFTTPLTPADLQEIFYRRDTLLIIDPEFTYGEDVRVIDNDIFYEDVKKYRIQEVWFFNTITSTMEVRILGIAPLLSHYDENGNFLYEAPMFWVHYPSAREYLADLQVFNEGNQSSRVTYEDLFENRQFNSHIYKEANVRDYRLQDMYTGVDLLLEAQKVEQEIQNYEHDLWSY
ncbi:MAG: gliding motility protein GldN [Bacteroidota bacterium]